MVHVESVSGCVMGNSFMYTTRGRLSGNVDNNLNILSNIIFKGIHQINIVLL